MAYPLLEYCLGNLLTFQFSGKTPRISSNFQYACPPTEVVPICTVNLVIGRLFKLLVRKYH